MTEKQYNLTTNYNVTKGPVALTTFQNDFGMPDSETTRVNRRSMCMHLRGRGHPTQLSADCVFQNVNWAQSL